MINKSKQKGLFLILYLILFTVLLLICGFVIDFGLMYNARIELKKATDQAALAGALKLISNEDIDSGVNALLAQNKVLGESIDEAQIVLGQFDEANQTFSEDTNSNPTAVQVSTTFTGETIFGKIIQQNSYTLHARSIATIEDKRPIELMLIADISTHMSLASQLQGIDLGVPSETVLKNLSFIYNQFQQKQLLPPSRFGGLTWDQIIPANPQHVVLRRLQLTDVPYPFPGLTWANYVDYVQNLMHYNQRYKNHYGFLTLINFWQEKAFMASQTPILKEGAEQPLQSVKNALIPLTEGLNPDRDKVGLGLISPKEQLVLAFSSQLGALSAQMNLYQAGHYGLPNGTISSAVSATLSAFSTKNRNRVIFILANGQSVWGEGAENTLASLKQAKIKAFRLVIGENNEEELNHQLTHQTGGKVWQVPLDSQDYTEIIQDFLITIQMGSPRLVQ